ncbi:MAG: SDR family oxidoreductase [Arhodomonas sp.]|nr:SDR family oxidoreductase [Arhodomonas sp.]
MPKGRGWCWPDATRGPSPRPPSISAGDRRGGARPDGRHHPGGGHPEPVRHRHHPFRLVSTALSSTPAVRRRGASPTSTTVQSWQQRLRAQPAERRAQRARRAAEPARQRTRGAIVSIASSSIREPIDGLLLSNVFRAGLLGLTETLAAELAGDGILVNTIGPGRIDTERVRELDAARAEREQRSLEAVRKESLSRIPLGRHGEPAELARVVAFLASPANGYVTSQALLVDGGMVRAL